MKLSLSKNSTKAVIILAALSLLIFSFLGVNRIYSLNTRFPQASVVSHKMGEEIAAGNISLVFRDYKLLSGADFRKLFPDYLEAVRNPDMSIVGDEQRYVLLAYVKIKNPTEETKNISLAPITAESISWANGIDSEIFTHINPNQNDPTAVPIPAQGELDLTLPYSIYDFQFSAQDWAKLPQKAFDIVLSFYPQRNIVLLK